MDLSESTQLTRQLVEHAMGWRYEDLPPQVIETTKLLILDTLGVIGGAADAPGIADLHARLSRWETAGSASSLLTGARLSPPSAAMANGAAAHALDFDDVHDPARVHTSTVVLPTLLATAQDAGPISGKDFLLAMATGAELHARFGLACVNSLAHGWHPTMTFGALAAALAAAKLLRLDVEKAGHALGLAYHQAGGSAQSMRDGVLSKRLGPGFAARSAVLAAFLAADGISGTRRTLEGSAGLFALYERGEVRLEALMGELGSKWQVPQYSFKPFPCCRCKHASIGVALALHRQGIRADDIASLEIGLGEMNWIAVGQPYDAARDEVVHAQFNVAYGFARAIVDGRVDLRSYRRPAITDPAVARLAARIVAVKSPSIAAESMERATYTLRLASGEVRHLEATSMKGSPEDPLTREELSEKLRGCFDVGLGASRAQADRLAQVVLALDQSSDAARSIVESFPTPTK